MTEPRDRARLMFACPSDRDSVIRRSGYYQLARHAEADREVARALSLYEQAILSDDRVDQSLKDLVSLLHMLGRLDEAIAFVQRCAQNGPWIKRYHSIIRNLQILSFKPPVCVSSRTIAADPCCPSCSVPCSHSPAGSLRSKIFLGRALSTYRKLLRVLIRGSGAYMEFSSHSAARKTLFNCKLPGYQFRLLRDDERVQEFDFSKISKLPVIVEWREAKPVQEGTPEILVGSVLAGSGAFDEFVYTREPSPQLL